MQTLTKPCHITTMLKALPMLLDIKQCLAVFSSMGSGSDIQPLQELTKLQATVKLKDFNGITIHNV